MKPLLVSHAPFLPQLLILTYLSIRARRRAAAEAKAAEEAAAAGTKPVEASAASASAAAVAGSGTVELAEGAEGKADNKLVDEEEEEEDGGHHTLAGETEAQRVLRRHVFMHDAVSGRVFLVAFGACCKLKGWALLAMAKARRRPA